MRVLPHDLHTLKAQWFIKDVWVLMIHKIRLFFHKLKQLSLISDQSPVLWSNCQKNVSHLCTRLPQTGCDGVPHVSMCFCYSLSLTTTARPYHLTFSLSFVKLAVASQRDVNSFSVMSEICCVFLFSTPTEGKLHCETMWQVPLSHI